MSRVLANLLVDMLLLDAANKVLPTDAGALVAFEVRNVIAGTEESACTSWALDVLICWVRLSQVRQELRPAHLWNPYLLAMTLAPTETPEVLAAELADDMVRMLVRPVTHLSFEPGAHRFDFVLGQGCPVKTIHVTFLAIEVIRCTLFVPFHVFDGGKAVLASYIGALHWQ